MSLLAAFLAITVEWRQVFPQQRTFERARHQALGSLVCLGRRCLSRIHLDQRRPAPQWERRVFSPLPLSLGAATAVPADPPACLGLLPATAGGVALDDTRLRKTGRLIPQAFYQRDPLSPPFHVNLMLGLRFLQASLLVPLHRSANVSTRALPIRFQQVSRVKRPGKRASQEQHKQYRAAVRQQNLSHSFVEMGQQLRQELDVAGGRSRTLVLAGDGSFCNRTCFAGVPERSVLLVRARKDAKLCFRAPTGSRRFYAVEKFTPQQVRADDSCGWKITKVFYGGKRRKIRYKEVGPVHWQRGAGQRPLRLFVIAPTPYRKSKSKRIYYRDPAYLLTTDRHSSVRQLLQIYFDRWQIEVNHREEKDTLGVGQAQLWNVNSVPKQPVLAVAAYSALLLAALQAFGPQRGPIYAELPKWRRNARRPSCLDLITLLRKEMSQQPELLAPLKLTITDQDLVRAAVA